jgi:hypothetical protein
MFPPLRVALVRLEAEVKEGPSADELAVVASALQTQVLRDVAPLWGVSAVVSAFPRLELVPDGYALLAVTNTLALPLHRSGFHFTAGGRPAAMIEYCGDWSNSASHELIEMLCDPTGTKTRIGPSLADWKFEHAPTVEPVVGEGVKDPEQGLVAYVMEVCDPCEDSAYTINGVSVADFVTPAFYEKSPGPLRLSFLGDVREPFHVRPGGYITWATGRPDPYVFQATMPGDAKPSEEADRLTITRLGTLPALLSRSWVDSEPDAKEGIRAKPCPRPPDKQRYVVARDDEAQYGSDLRQQLINARPEEHGAVALAHVMELVMLLASDKGFRDAFEADPARALAEKKIPLSADALEQDTKLQPPEMYQQLQHSLEQSHRIGFKFNELYSLIWTAKFPIG